jgi:uncharacterized phage protein gp47/JayE
MSSSSDEYGLQDTQFRVKTLPVILAENLQMARNLTNSRVSLQEDDVLYQMILLFSTKEERLWRLVDTLAQNMSISGASGLFQDRLGEDLGIDRTGAEQATVNLLITGVPGSTIPVGSLFSTYEGIVFQTTEAAVLPATIAVTRSESNNRDTLTSPYSGLVVVDWISNSLSGASPFTANVDYIVDYDNNIIDWTPAGIQPADGATYYVRVSSSISVTVAAESVLSGAITNVPANTITQIDSTLAGVTTVNNPLSTGTTGSDAEDGSEYRLRELRAPRRNWTIERIESLVLAMDGVQSVKVFEGEAIDQHNSEENLTLEREVLGQLFRPGERIGTISAASLQTRVFGIPGDLMVELYRCQTDALANISYDDTINSPRLAYSRIAPSDIDPLRTTEWFEHTTIMRYNHLDNTRQYMLVIYALSENSTNYYEFRYGNLGLFRYGGLYRNGIFAVSDNLWFRTHYNVAAFTVVVAPETVLSDTLESSILAGIQGTGRPVSVQAVVEEASQYQIQVRGRIRLESDEYTMSEISNGIEVRLANFLASLEIGDDVLWSDMTWAIKEEAGVRDYDNVRIAYMGPQDTTFRLLGELENLRIEDREIATQATVGVLFEQYWSEG